MAASPTEIKMPSVRSLLLRLGVAGQDLSIATGFVALHAQKNYLVTNWHVVAGRRPDTGAPMASNGAVPDRITIMHNVAGHLGRWEPKRQPLYDPGGMPLWLEHPTLGRKVDVAVVPLESDESVAVYPYEPANPGQPILFCPSVVAAIVGFPFGITAGGCLGIWADGTIASEPGVDFQDLPCFLIDSRTRAGQSGSPVVLFRIGTFIDEDMEIKIGKGKGAAERFVGVYSGRINPESDLGFVWKTSALVEILNGQKRGPMPRVGPV
jgi:hypothetical protein